MTVTWRSEHWKSCHVFQGLKFLSLKGFIIKKTNFGIDVDKFNKSVAHKLILYCKALMQTSGK